MQKILCRSGGLAFWCRIPLFGMILEFGVLLGEIVYVLDCEPAIHSQFLDKQCATVRKSLDLSICAVLVGEPDDVCWVEANALSVADPDQLL